MKKLFIGLLALCLCLFATTAMAEDAAHEWSAWETTPATCVDAGAETRHCTVEGCNATETNEIPATGNHTPVTTPDAEDLPVDPTCTEAGHTLLVHCAVCGTQIEGEVIPAAGHSWETKASQAATCTEDGYSEYVACAVCGEIDPAHPKIKTEDAKGHTPVPAEDFVAPDCTAAAPLSVKAKCDVCGEELLDNIIIPVGEHNWETVEALAPTCTENGYESYMQCSVCGATDPDPIVVVDALGHDFSVWKGALAGDCTHNGALAGHYCSRCGEPEFGGMILEAPGHKAKTIPGKAPTCTETGLTKGKKCSVCGEILTAQEEIPALGHDWETILGTKATCTEDGIGAHRLCKVCGEVEWLDPSKKVIPAHGHSNVEGYWPEYGPSQAIAGTARPAIGTMITDEENEKAKPATCTEDGYKAQEICAFCGEELVPSEVLPKLGHDWKLAVPGTLPTCTAEGVSDLWACDRCDAAKGGEVINPRGHALTTVAEELPDCDKPGHFAYSKCTRTDCGYAEAKAGLQMVDSRLPEALQVVAALPGDINDATDVITAQMPETGHPDAFVVAAYDHYFREPVVALAPTCTENGIDEGATRCLICGEYFDLHALKALGHNVVSVDAIEPTCLEAGLKAYDYCDRCGKAVEHSDASAEELQEQLTASEIVKPENADPAEMIIAALGHDAQPGVALDPTCLDAGHTAGVYCARCGMTLEEQEEIAALGHDMQETEAEAAPTCTEAGHTAVLSCTRCDYQDGGEEIPALGHDAGEPTAKKEPTCTEYGFTEGAHCTRCEVDYEPVLNYLLGNDIISGADLYEAGWLKVPELIDPLGHDMAPAMNAEPTCTEEGYDNYAECTRCDYHEGEILHALGHDWIDVPGGAHTAPTCTVAGMDGLHQCARCLTTEVKLIPALGHDLVAVEAKAPTCVDDGNIAYDKCSRCGKLFVDGASVTEADVILPATGVHTLEHMDAERPTCHKAGHTEGQYCTVCGYTLCTELAPDPEGWHAYLTSLIVDEDGNLIEEKVAELVAEGKLKDIIPEDATTPGSGMRVICCAEDEYPLYVELYPAVKLGDVNMDGKVNSTDALMVLQYYAGVLSDLPNKVAADFNGDGKINSSDALAILVFYVQQ